MMFDVSKKLSRTRDRRMLTGVALRVAIHNQNTPEIEKLDRRHRRLLDLISKRENQIFNEAMLASEAA